MFCVLIQSTSFQGYLLFRGEVSTFIEKVTFTLKIKETKIERGTPAIMGKCTEYELKIAILPLCFLPFYLIYLF